MSIHNTQGGASIFFSKTPDFGQLCSVVCQIEHVAQSASRSSSSSIHTPSYGLPDQAKVGQSNVLKCRELIFTESSLLASPSLQEEGHIYVILTRDLWHSGKFQERCQKMGLQFGKPMRVISAVFQACFAYTLKAKLAPSWNKLGACYVQGRDFITATGLLGAISLETNITDGEICLAIKPMTVKLPHCTLQEFGVCPPIISHFLNDLNYIISEYSVDDKWCYVLPSLKKGKVVSIMHSLPASSPFKTYNDLRRYWKNTYGYRLPENGEDLVYINIFFPAIPNTIFTYPEFCIRKQDFRKVPRVDSTPVLQAFLADIKKKMPKICEFPLEVTRKAQYTAVTMNSASGQIGSTNLSSLTLVSKPSTVAQRIPPRSLVPLKDTHNQTPVCRQQFSPYQSLTGETRIRSNTGYALQTPSYPSGLSSYGGYNTNGQSSRVSSYYQQQQQQKQMQNVFSPGQQNTSVTAAEHHLHQHLPSPRPIPHPAEVGTASSNRMTPSMMMMNSPVQQMHSPYGCTSDYVSPRADGYPYGQSSPMPSDDFTSSPGWKQSGRYSTSVEVAAKTIADPSHTMFSLAVHLRNQGPQHAGDAPGQCSSGTPLHHMAQPRTAPTERMRNASLMHDLIKPQQTQLQNPYTNNAGKSWNQGNYSGHSGSASSNNLQYPQSQPDRRFVPIFNPKPSRSYPTTSTTRVPPGPKFVPSFMPQKKRAVAATAPKPTATASAYSTHRAAGCPPSPVIVVDDEDVIPPTQQQWNTHQKPHSTTLPKQQHSTTMLQQQHSGGLPSTTPHPPPMRQMPTFGASKTSSFKPLVPNLNRQPAETTTSDSGATAKKRKSKDTGNAENAKKSKPRSKPKVQENVNVKQMAHSDQLSKLNTITLVTWLKEKGVAVTSRDKKSDLVAKVMTFINCTAKES